MYNDEGTKVIKLKEKKRRALYDISFNVSTDEYRKYNISSLKFENIIRTIN